MRKYRDRVYQLLFLLIKVLTNINMYLYMRMRMSVSPIQRIIPIVYRYTILIKNCLNYKRESIHARSCHKINRLLGYMKINHSQYHIRITRKTPLILNLTSSWFAHILLFAETGIFTSLSLLDFIRSARAGVWLTYWGSTRPTFDLPRHGCLSQSARPLCTIAAE